MTTETQGRQHDTFPVRLKGNRWAYLMLPVDLTLEDAVRLIKHVQFIAECSIDHVKPQENGNTGSDE